MSQKQQTKSFEFDKDSYFCPVCESTNAPALFRVVKDKFGDPQSQVVVCCDNGHVSIYDDIKLGYTKDEYSVVWEFGNEAEEGDKKEESDGPVST